MDVTEKNFSKGKKQNKTCSPVLFYKANYATAFSKYKNINILNQTFIDN